MTEVLGDVCELALKDSTVIRIQVHCMRFRAPELQVCFYYIFLMAQLSDLTWNEVDALIHEI